jgi:hypothetical protein
VRGRLGPIAVHPDSARVYVCALDQGSVTCFDIVKPEYVGRALVQDQPAAGVGVFSDPAIVAVAFPNGSPFSSPGYDKPGCCWLYDANSFTGRLDAPVPERMKVVGDVLDLPDAGRIEVEPMTKRAWIAYRNGLAALDPSKTRPTTRITIDECPSSFRFETGGRHRVFINAPKKGQVVAADPTKGEVVDRWKLLDAKDSGPMALDEASRRLFVVCRKPARVFACDTDTGRVVAWADCIADAGDAHFDESRRRLYVSGDGVIGVFGFEKDKFKLLGKVTVAPGARTSAWIPSSGRLCVGVPLKGKDCEVWVYRAQQ